MDKNLPNSLRLMFGHEGGYVNAATDRGGPTKYGITHKTLAAHLGLKSVTAERVKAMTMAEAEEIYRRSYWNQSGGAQLPSGLDYAAFDFGVNSGPPRAVKTLQKVLGFTGKDVDGWIGELTMNRVNDYPGGTRKLIRDYCEARMDFFRSLKNPKTGFPVNGRGWTIRLMGTDPKGEWKPVPGVIGNALAMCDAEVSGQAPEKVVKPVAPPPTMTDQVTAKAEPAAPNPWIKPEVLTPLLGGGTMTAILGFLQSDPIKAALAVGILAAIAIGSVLAFRRIKKAEAA
jgi:lysozyme family protein